VAKSGVNVSTPHQHVSLSADWFYQANMKVITSIYLNCRPDLRDEWLTGNEAEDAVEALVRATKPQYWKSYSYKATRLRRMLFDIL